MGICPTDGVQQGIMGLVWPRFCRAGVRGVVFELPLDSTLSNQQSWARLSFPKAVVICYKDGAPGDFDKPTFDSLCL